MLMLPPLYAMMIRATSAMRRRAAILCYAASPMIERHCQICVTPPAVAAILMPMFRQMPPRVADMIFIFAAAAAGASAPCDYRRFLMPL